MSTPDPQAAVRAVAVERLACLDLDHPGDRAEAVAVVTTALQAAERGAWNRASVVARTFFAPSTEPADISARECGELIADAILDYAPKEAENG